jgi:hypothetical protein
MTDPHTANMALIDQAAAFCRESVSNMMTTYRLTMECPNHPIDATGAMLAVTQSIIEWSQQLDVDLAPYLGMAIQMLVEQEGSSDDHDTNG